jgi:hypothetical protein
MLLAAVPADFLRQAQKKLGMTFSHDFFDPVFSFWKQENKVTPPNQTEPFVFEVEIEELEPRAASSIKGRLNALSPRKQPEATFPKRHVRLFQLMSGFFPNCRVNQ